MNKATAKISYLRMAPRKVRLVADLVRGLHANEAEAQLLMQRKRAAKPLLKLLRSAMANAKNMKLEPKHLFVAEIFVNGGPMLKRFLPRARGSASPIQKKMSHVTLVLGENAALREPRFNIQVVKKAKLPEEPKGKPKEAKRGAFKEEKKAAPQEKKLGFLKRVFSPKSRTAK